MLLAVQRGVLAGARVPWATPGGRPLPDPEDFRAVVVLRHEIVVRLDVVAFAVPPAGKVQGVLYSNSMRNGSHVIVGFARTLRGSA